MTVAKSLQMLEVAGQYWSDHNPLILRVARNTLQLRHAPAPNPSAASGVRMQYDDQKAEAYECL